MRPEDIPLIRQLPLFASMSAENFDRLLQTSYLQWFPAGVTLIREGDPADFFHVVVDGAVELFAGWSGRETTMQIVRPVETIILAATVRDAPFLMSARTLERSHIVLVPSQDVRQIFASDGAFARAVVAELAGVLGGAHRAASIGAHRVASRGFLRNGQSRNQACAEWMPSAE